MGGVQAKSPQRPGHTRAERLYVVGYVELWGNLPYFEVARALLPAPRSLNLPKSCRFEQAFSADGGRTWEVNWIATDTRIGDETRP